MEHLTGRWGEEVNEKMSKLAYFYSIQLPNIVKLGKADYPKAHNALEEHVHPDCFEVCYHYNGQQRYVIGDTTFQTKSGDLFITLPNEKHGTGASPEEKSGLFYLVFQCMPDTKNFLGLNGAETEHIKHSLFSIKKRVFHGNPKIKNLFNDILDIYFCQHDMKAARIYALFIEFFYLLTKDIDVANRDLEDIPDDIAEAMKWIDQHYAGDVNTNALADRVFLYTSQFKRKFKKYTGFSPYDYIVRKKIGLSKERLHSGMSITEIAVELGFSSSQHFATVFKKYLDQTPSEFRKKSKRESSGE